MPKSGVLVLLVAVVTVTVALGWPAPGSSPAVYSSQDGAIVASESAVEAEAPILEFAAQGWLERTLTVVTNASATGPIEIVVELRFTWSGGIGQVRVVGSEANGRYGEVITDETRLDGDLEAPLGHFQRMFNELRNSGGSVEVVEGVTIARQFLPIPDGEAEDVWRIGVGDPEW